MWCGLPFYPFQKTFLYYCLLNENTLDGANAMLSNVMWKGKLYDSKKFSVVETFCHFPSNSNAPSLPIIPPFQLFSVGMLLRQTFMFGYIAHFVRILQVNCTTQQHTACIVFRYIVHRWFVFCLLQHYFIHLSIFFHTNWILIHFYWFSICYLL